MWCVTHLTIYMGVSLYVNLVVDFKILTDKFANLIYYVREDDGSVRQ